MRRNDARVGLFIGMAAAATFGASTPIAKLLLDDTRPQMLAGLLYLGAFLALVAVLPVRGRTVEARLRRADSGPLFGLVLCGGILAPLLLLVGLERVSGSTGSLLLNLEGPFTLLIGLAVFREHLGRRAAWGAVVVFGGSALLSWGGVGGSIDVVGLLCIAAACLLWGVDNNLTQSLTVRDPFSLVRLKAGVAAAVNVAIAVALGARLPAVGITAAALGVGAIAYGVSIVLDAYALRRLGAARESVVFATAPFVGAALALPLLSESLSAVDLIAGLLMAFGVALMLGERHEHPHAHEPLEHDHVHVHDEHHQHDHLVGDPPGEPHAHGHRHERLVHTHAHVSDVHHRHGHSRH